MSDSILYEVTLDRSVFETILVHICSVKYYDPPVILYLAFLVSWFYLYFRGKGITTVLTVQFLITMIALTYTEDVNSYFSKNWPKYYFSQNYFDDTCIFILIFWFLPLSTLSVLIAIQFLLDLCKTISIHLYFNSILSKK